MIEELKQLLVLIQGVPDMVMHVLLGFAAYKIIIFLGTSAGIYGTIRLGINKWHDYATKKMSAPKRLEWDRHGTFINSSDFDRLIRIMKNRPGRSSLSYIHSEDVDWIENKVKDAP